MPNDKPNFCQARKDFLIHLRYIRGHSERTCYNYHSDLGIWGKWLEEAGKDWRSVDHVDVEQFAAWQMRERNVKPHRRTAGKLPGDVL